MKDCMAVLLAVVLFLAPCAPAAVRAQALELKTGTASLSIKDHDGTGLAKALVKLMTADGELQRTVTADPQGECELKDLKVGSYKLIIADRAVLPLTVSDKGKVTSLLVVLPAPVKYAAGDAKKAFALPTLLTFIIGAVAVGGLTVAAASGGGGGGGHP